VYDLMTSRALLVRDLTTQARIIGSNCTAALTFRDVDAATEILTALRVKPSIVAAGIFLEDGHLFAKYAQPQANARPLPAHSPRVGVRVSQGSLEVIEPIELNGEVLGTLYLRSDMRDWYARSVSYALIVAAMLLGSGLVAFLLSSRLQRLITEPILRLVETMRTVSSRRDYSVRAVRTSDDEVGALIDGFNRMLDEIEARDRALRSANDDLEARVRERTEELEAEVAERRRAEVELAEARDKALEAARAKSAFLANMSHELRTPMNGIIGMTELALDTSLSQEQREYLTLVRSCADSLLTLLNDILDFSRIEAGKLEFERLPFDLRENVAETLKTLAMRAHEKGLELACEIGSDVPECVVGDPGRIRQIFVNLVGNAIKFTERGEVVVRVDLEAATDESVRLHASVTDTGIGIPKEKLGLVFQAFTQADGSTTRQYGGTGLGLTISQQLVQMMNGRIWAESELGRGSTFHFTLALGRPTRRQAEEVRLTGRASGGLELLEDVAALVVDDSATSVP